MPHPSIRVASAPVSWGIMEDNDDSGWLPPEQVMAEIRAAGFEGTELGPLGYYPTHPAQLRVALARHQLTLTAAFVMIGFFEPGRREADLAAARLLEDLAREFRSLNLSTVFHLESDSHLESPADLDRMCRETDPDLVGICLDTGHHYYNGGNPRAAVKQYGRRIRHVHLKDVDPAVLARVRAAKLDFY